MSSGALTISAPHRAIVINPRVRGCSVRRYYDPATGQFISVDPLVGQTEQPYSYAAGDPIDSIDPTGLDICLFGHCAPTPSLQHVSDAVAGFGDTITFGGTAWVRGQINDAFGLPNSVDYCSSWYSGGGLAGVGTTLFLGGYGLLGDAAEGGGLLMRLRSIEWADERGSLGFGDLPPRARTFADFDEAAAHLERFHGIDPRLASARLHAIKAEFGYSGADNLLIDRTGNVYDPITREWLGSLTEGGG